MPATDSTTLSRSAGPVCMTRAAMRPAKSFWKNVQPCRTTCQWFCQRTRLVSPGTRIRLATISCAKCAAGRKIRNSAAISSSCPPASRQIASGSVDDDQRDDAADRYRDQRIDDRDAEPGHEQRRDRPRDLPHEMPVEAQRAHACRRAPAAARRAEARSVREAVRKIAALPLDARPGAGGQSAAMPGRATQGAVRVNSCLKDAPRAPRPLRRSLKSGKP